MARDIMYYFDKKSPFARHELGEIQSDFNMGLTIDGDKDSMQVQLYSFIGKAIEPNTILYHNATNTWWIVRKDSIKRYANEKDYYYIHNISIQGAINLLNARDLTDCGFNDRKYTIEQFIRRLFKLSTFEFPRLSIDFGNNIDSTKEINYVKTFENYTLLSALREFLNGYNCDAKLSFSLYSDRNEINWAIIKIIPKTGNIDLPILSIDVFDDVRESKSIDKESFGTTAISNASNVISTLTKTYPQIGGVALNGTGYNITPANAFLKLPSPIYKLNWLKMYHAVKLYVIVSYQGSSRATHRITFPTILDEENMDQVYDAMARQIADDFSTFSGSWSIVYNNVLSQKEKLYEMIKLAGCITLKTGWKMNAKTKTYVAPQNDPDFYFPRITKEQRAQTPILENAVLLLGSKEDYEAATYPQRCIYYERGSDKIENFGWMSAAGSSYLANEVVSHLSSYSGTDLRGKPTSVSMPNIYPQARGSVLIQLENLGIEVVGSTERAAYYFNIPNITCQVNYVPMSDLKIKQDNSNRSIDSKLYNQNGKLNDSVALSKLLDTYSKEIQEETITRYMNYTNFNNIPKVGQLVLDGNKKFVITNISYDFVAHESSNSDVGYYIECEFTLSNYVSTKSIMTSPNSNIRDYGIPQKFNVKRRQTYRDYFEFSLSQDNGANQEQPYVSLNKYLSFGRTSFTTEYDHTAIMKLTYEDLVDGQDEWYYQLNTTAYVLDRAIYEVVDFNDNNIIGYDMQNTTSGFIMNDLFNSIYFAVNTPISYTDDRGNVKGIYLAMVNKDNLLELYNELKGSRTYTNLVKHCFVGSEFYYGVSDTQTFSGWTAYAESESGMVDGHTTVVVEINFDGRIDANFDFDLVFSNPTLEYPIGSGTMLTDVYFDSITKVNDTTYRLVVVDRDSAIKATQFATPALDLGFVVEFKQSGSGARAKADYNLDEPNYEKDPVEVPVFEYSLQLGDTEQVEVGNRTFDIANRICELYGFEIRNPFTTNKLNASKYFDDPIIDGQTISVDDYSYQYNVSVPSCAVMSLENDNKTLRIKFYNVETEVLYGNSDQDYFVENDYLIGSQINKGNFIGRDVVIYKSMITKLFYDNGVVDSDFQNELMFIIHNPQDSNFDGDDLLVNVNYYKLK